MWTGSCTSGVKGAPEASQPNENITKHERRRRQFRFDMGAMFV
jgi:hypothetical protein